MKNVKCKYCHYYKNEWCEPKTDSPEPTLVRDCDYYKEKTKRDWLSEMDNHDLANTLAAFSLPDSAHELEKWLDTDLYEGDRRMNDFISRQDIRDETLALGNHSMLTEWDTMGVLRLIDRQKQIDAVEVVRCGQCKYWNNCIHNPNVDDTAIFDENDFCSQGELK